MNEEELFLKLDRFDFQYRQPCTRHVDYTAAACVGSYYYRFPSSNDQYVTDNTSKNYKDALSYRITVLIYYFVGEKNLPTRHVVAGRCSLIITYHD